MTCSVQKIFWEDFSIYFKDSWVYHHLHLIKFLKNIFGANLVKGRLGFNNLKVDDVLCFTLVSLLLLGWLGISGFKGVFFIIFLLGFAWFLILKLTTLDKLSNGIFYEIFGCEEVEFEIFKVKGMTEALSVLGEMAS